MSESSAEHFEAMGGWPGVLRELSSGNDLSTSQANLAMSRVLDGTATDAQTAAFIFGLKVKGESAQEVAGLVQALLDAAAPLQLDSPQDVLDIVGTGGSRALGGRAFNVSTMAAIVAAGAGAVVCKHGNRKASSTSGSTDLLEELGVSVELDGSGVARCVGETGLGFAFARVFHPSMRFAATVRGELGVPTIFNVLGPLSHPARVGRQLLGVSDPALLDLVAGSLAERGITRAWVINGDSSLDELTTTGPNTVIEVAAQQPGEQPGQQPGQHIRRFQLDAREFGLPRVSLSQLGVGDATDNARVAREVLAGELGPFRDMVVLNAGAGLVVAGVSADIAAGIAAACESIDSGEASRILNQVVEATRSASGAEAHGG